MVANFNGYFHENFGQDLKIVVAQIDNHVYRRKWTKILKSSANSPKVKASE